MAIPVIESVKTIEQQFNTGEEPVLVTCSDMNTYVCKYMRSSAASYKLVCELVGAQMASSWQLPTPEIAFVQIKQKHWNSRQVSHNLSAPAIGSKRIEGVVDITPSTYQKVAPKKEMLQQLLEIALFDFWMANEDRNANNANLLYNVVQERLVPIDYGCIFNTATFDFPLSQLTTTDSILSSDLFHHLTKDKPKELYQEIIAETYGVYINRLKRSKLQLDAILSELPKEWNVPREVVANKLSQLFDNHWTSETWKNFVECLNENICNE